MSKEEGRIIDGSDTFGVLETVIARNGISMIESGQVSDRMIDKKEEDIHYFRTFSD